MKTLLSLIILVLLVVSCNKQDDGVFPETLETPLLIKTVLTNGEVTESFDYDVTGRLIARNGTYELSAIRIEIEYQEGLRVFNYYDVQDVLVKTINNYIEQNINVRQVDVDIETGEELNYRLYNTNLNTCNLDSIGFYDSQDVEILKITFSYIDDNCSTNVTLADDNPDNRARNETVNDNKNRSIKSLDYPFYNTVFGHNRVSYTNYTSDNEVISGTSYTSAYTYNEFDYPITETRTYGDGRVENYTYEYY